MDIDLSALSGRPLLATTQDQEFFVDANDAAKRLSRAVSARLNVLVLGATGSGKTSMLHNLSHRLTGEAPKTIYVDGAYASNAVEFLALVAFGLGHRPGPFDEFEKMRRGLAGDRHPLPEIGRLLEIVEILRRQSEEEHGSTAILVDGLPADVVQAIFGRLRNELWQLSLRWVVAGDNEHRGDYLREPANAFFDDVVVLPALSPDSARDILKRRVGGGLSGRIADEVIEHALGNPRRLLGLAREVLSGRETATEILSDEAQWQSRLGELSRPMRMLVSELDRLDRPISASDPALLAQLGWTRARAAQVLRELEVLGLVVSAHESVRIGPGRPRKIYSLTAHGGATSPLTAEDSEQ
jgi:energy-coupling factor transporter ATP-binding protein EcfA2